MLDLSVVVVTYKEDPEVLKRCFESLSASTGLSFELIVVDNARRSDTEALLKQTVASAHYVPNPKNMGFAYAVNCGMRVAKGSHILLLNPDTEFKPEVLKTMVAHLDASPEVGIASSIIRYPNGDLQESIRRFPTLLNQLVILLKIPHLLKRTKIVDHYMMRDADPNQTQDVDSIMGAFMFIPRATLEKIGLFDERYFIWFEEVDYCKMASSAGLKIRHYADVEILHHKGHSFNKLATLKKQRWIRQSLRKYMRKHHGLLPWAILWLLTPWFIVLAYGSAVIKRG
ncbi:MAG: glycosyltransferase family 2 protein [Patescibacteria group bacterium]